MGNVPSTNAPISHAPINGECDASADTCTDCVKPHGNTKVLTPSNNGQRLNRARATANQPRGNTKR